MTTELSIAVAALAGLLSFFSPCVLPLLPSYLSFVGGVSYAELSGAAPPRARIVVRTLLFVLGFTIVFVAFGILFSSSWFLFSGIGRWINIVAGGVVVALGLNVIFDFVKILNVEKRVHVQRRPTGYFGAVLVGMAFGAGWSPCIGPILASILLLAGTSGNIATGAVYLAVYSVALGLPFVAAGLAFGTLSRRLNAIKRHMNAIRWFSGAFLVAMGLLIAFGRFQQLNGLLLSWGYGLESWNAANPAAGRAIGAAVLAAIGVVYPARVLLRGTESRRFGPIRTVLSALFLLGAVAHAAGIVDVTAWMAGWLTYQGI